jgi:4'-phosphopantetheinyl transferase EntD
VSVDAYHVVRAGDASRALGALVPVDAVAVEARGPVAPDPLLPAERAQVANAVDKRRREFALGRSCARRALAALGVAPAVIVNDAGRAPVWPAGVIGSITHTHDYCCAVVARAGGWASLGLDAELLRPLEPGVCERIVLPAEAQQLATLEPAIAWPCVVFSIKEAIYKASFPLDRRWLDFLDVEVRLDPARGAFAAHELANPARTFSGRFAVDGAHVISLLAMPGVASSAE